MSDPRVVVVGLRRPGDADTADARLRALVQAMPLIDLVVWAPKAGPALVRTAFRAGAADVLITSSSRVVARAVERVIEAQRVLPRAAQEGDDGRPPVAQQFEGLLSRSPKMHDLFEMVLQVAESDATVLIMGETGTGKELLARAIHRRSQRSTGRFVAVNCGAIQETLIETELFGHEAGAFTGATSPKPGLFRHAEGGTLMLDEVGTLPMNSQYSLLRVLQESTVRPVGGYGETPVDVRVVAATSTPLVDAMAAGSFRDDLFYRLDVIRLDVPPLRERREDIIYLFSLFARQFAEQYSLPRPEVSDDFLDGLVNFDWPGNV
ncbi:MAG: sigma-54 dependent transcriptional regulator, partial [Myxococcota bacterium]